MSSDCACERCKDRRSISKHPLHLKAYDDSNGPHIFVQDDAAPIYCYHPPRCGTWRDMGRKVPECACERCQHRIKYCKGPIHLKKFDDTPHKPWLCACIDDCNANTCSDDCMCSLCSLERRDTMPWTVWCRPGALLNRYWPESAYKKNRYHDVVPGKVNYDRCHPGKLKKFVLQRGLKDPFPAGLTLKTTYIRILNAADLVRTFRFLDLPPEMRNLVYYELLILRKRRRTHYSDKPGFKFCDPQILATCREVHSDATGILYGDNPIMCDFEVNCGAEWPDIWVVNAKIQLHHEGDEETHRPGLRDFTAPDEEPQTFKEHKFIQTCARLSAKSLLRKTTNIHINIKLGDFGDFKDPQSCGFRARGAMQNMLLAFSSTLMNNHRLKTVVITVEAPYWCEIEPKIHSLRYHQGWAESTLYPLRRLRGIETVELWGDMSDEEAASTQADMQSDQPAYNTFQELCLLGLRHELYTELLRDIPDGSWLVPHDSGQGNDFEMSPIWSEGPQLPRLDLEQAMLGDAEHEAEVRPNITRVKEMLEGFPSSAALLERLPSREELILLASTKSEAIQEDRFPQRRSDLQNHTLGHRPGTRRSIQVRKLWYENGECVGQLFGQV